MGEITREINCASCGHAFTITDVDYESQRQAAIILERRGFKTTMLTGGWWKIEGMHRGKGSDGVKQSKFVDATEWISGIELVKRSKQYAGEEAEENKPAKKRKNKATDNESDQSSHTEVSLARGRSSKSVERELEEQAESVHSNPDKRRRKQRRTRRNGSRSSKDIQSVDTRTEKGARKSSTVVRQPRKRISSVASNNGAGKTSLGRKRRSAVNRKKSSRTRSRS